MKKKFYDTCSLLQLKDLKAIGTVIVSSVTLKELEHIKTSSSKDAETKFAARRLLRHFEANPSAVLIIPYKKHYSFPFIWKGFPISNDIRILATAVNYNKVIPIEFITNDLALKQIAKMFLPKVNSIKEAPEEDYKGYKKVYLTNDEICDVYTDPKKNHFNLIPNQYLFICDTDGELIDTLCWTGKNHRPLKFHPFDSKYFGEVKPLKDDMYQLIAADSLANNQITMIKGPAGSGKTFLSLGYLLHQVERKKLDKIIVFCNTIATKNSAKLGYYPGTRDEKLLDSQIGNLLSSKLGSKEEVERMISSGKLVLLPMSDIRGYDTSGMRAGIYISEAQNLDISLMKLALQRIGEDSVCIIDGDCKAQVDDISFAGENNGMKRVTKIFKGQNIYGEVELGLIHRSKIAEIAEKL